MTTSDKPIRLIIQQPSLAKYRQPVFRALSNYPDIDLKLLYGSRPDLPNVEAEGFHAEPVYLWQKRFRGQQIFWHSAQWNSASRELADVLILTWNPRYVSLVPTLLKARTKGIPTILWGHGYSKNENSVRRRIRLATTRLATALLFYNQTAADQYIREGRDPSTVFVARNSLDQTPIREARLAWQQDPARLANFREENRIGSGPNFLFVSRFDPLNRLDMLIRAAAEMAPDFPHVQVLIVGKGEDEEHKLKALAQSLGISERVRFIGAIYDEMQLAPWFLSSDVFCYPANIGLSLLHAFGYGLPVVTSDDLASQNPEIEALKPGQNGLLYEHGSVPALVQALRTIVTDRELAARMSAEAIRTVEEEFSLRNMVEGMAAAVRYCAALAGPQRGPGD
jgi:glycosyltransferase involved in cell wall biosynthesis